MVDTRVSTGAHRSQLTRHIHENAQCLHALPRPKFTEQVQRMPNKRHAATTNTHNQSAGRSQVSTVPLALVVATPNRASRRRHVV